MRTCPVCGRESPDDFAFCPSCASSLVPEVAERAVRKTVSIVFCDVTGSTAMGEGLDPESLRAVLTRYFDTMRAAVERHGGTVEKYIGDAVMAVFGVPQLHEDDALRATRAAADMAADLAELNKELERDRGVTVQIRIGVNTGEVVANAGAGDQQLVTGDAVNVAARLEQHAAPGSILLGDPTYRLVRDAVDAEPVEALTAKGKSEPVPAWRLLEVHDVDAAVRRHLDAPMIGRERPLTQLRHAFSAAVEEGQCQLFTVLGPAGVGKSRLVEEFLHGIPEEITVLRGRCLPYGDGITYFPVVEAIKAAAGLADFDLPDVIEQKVCSVLEDDEHQALVCRHVSQLLGASDAAGGEETFWAIRRFFEALARERPLVLVFDDIHWGEDTFLDLIEHIAGWTRDVAMLLICMARSDVLDRRPSWGGGVANAATVSLEPLRPEQARALVASTLGDDIGAEVAGRIVEAAEGNPLFVEQTIEMLIDDGNLVATNSGWALADDADRVRVPPTIQALLAARLDQLNPDERATLEAASVIGKEFSLDAVASIVAETARSRVANDVRTAVRRELIRPERSTLPGHDAFRFRHQLVRDATYEAVPKAARGELHERFADWLEAVAGPAISEQEEIVGYHLEQAVHYRRELGPDDGASAALARRAATHLANGAGRAGDRGDHGAALRLYHRALALSPNDEPATIQLLYDTAVAESEMTDPRASMERFERVVTLAEREGMDTLAWLARIRASNQRSLVDPLATATDDALTELHSAITVFERADDDRSLATAWFLLASRYWIPCLFDRAKVAADRAADHAERARDQQLLATALLTSLAAGGFGSERPEDNLASIERAVSRGAGNRQLERFAEIGRATNLAMLGETARAREMLQVASVSMPLSEVGFSALAIRESYATIEFWIGDLASAESEFLAGYEELHGRGDDGHASTQAANVARTMCWRGQFEEVGRFADLAITLGAEDDLATQVPARIAKAWLLAVDDDGGGEEAVALATEAAHRYDGAEALNTQADALLDLGLVQRAAGRDADGRESIVRAMELYRRKGNQPMLERCQERLDEPRNS